MDNEELLKKERRVIERKLRSALLNVAKKR